MRLMILSTTLAILSAPLFAAGAPGEDLIHRPGSCAPGDLWTDMPAAFGPSACDAAGPAAAVAPLPI